jgi:hypothetical protein
MHLTPLTIKTRDTPTLDIKLMMSDNFLTLPIGCLVAGVVGGDIGVAEAVDGNDIDVTAAVDGWPLPVVCNASHV